MSVLTVVGIGLALLAPDRPGDAQPTVIRSTVASGPRIRPSIRVIPSPEHAHRVLSSAACVVWYYPSPAEFSKASGVTETFWLAGQPTYLSQYSGHPELVQVHDSIVNPDQYWNITEVTWDGSNWLKIRGTHAAVNEGGGGGGGGDGGGGDGGGPIPSKSPTIPSPVKIVPASFRATVIGPVGGSITVSLGPIDGITCRTIYFPCTYVD